MRGGNKAANSKQKSLTLIAKIIIEISINSFTQLNTQATRTRSGRYYSISYITLAVVGDLKIVEYLYIYLI